VEVGKCKLMVVSTNCFVLARIVSSLLVGIELEGSVTCRHCSLVDFSQLDFYYARVVSWG